MSWSDLYFQKTEVNCVSNVVTKINPIICNSSMAVIPVIYPITYLFAEAKIYIVQTESHIGHLCILYKLKSHEIPLSLHIFS